MVQGIASLGAKDQTVANQAPQAPGSEEVISSLGKAFSSLSVKEIQELKALSEQLQQMPQEQLQALSQVIDFIKKKSDQYDMAVQTLIRQGIVEPGDLPPEYVPAFFEILSGLVQDAMSKVQGPPTSETERPAFARGGIAQLKKAGRYGDTTLAHLSPKSAATLKRMGGSGTINPKTGLQEYFLGSIFKGIGNFLKSAAGVILPVALNFAFPGLGTIASGAIGAGLGALINGAKPGEALGAALTGGIGGALFSGISGMVGGQGFMSGITGALPAGFAGSTNVQPYVASWLGGSPSPAAGVATNAAGGLRSEAAMEASKSAAAAAQPGMFSKIGGWMSEHPYLTAAGAALAGTALGSSMSEAKDEKPMKMKGATQEMIDAARFPAGTFASRAAPKVQLTPTYSPAYAQGGEVDHYNRDGWKNKNPNPNPPPEGDGDGEHHGQGRDMPRNYPSWGPWQVFNRDRNQRRDFHEDYPNGKHGGDKNKDQATNSGIASTAGAFALRGMAPALYMTPTYSPAYAMGGETDARGGGHLRGPGTGTSDDIPARLSDGEFVMTAKAVRGAGGGSREKGARKMYDMMHNFEKRA